MAIRNIRLEGDEVLRKKSKVVDKIDAKILTLIKDMGETMYKADGVGLAAPQVGILKRIFVIDVYDGEDFNGYHNASVTSAATYFGEGFTKSTAKLVDMDYFTDTEKELTGVDRPTFMTLAPNSITKVRVYIWIEGQDVDNYDFASLGKQISVSFGFTKERFEQSEIITE